MKRKIKKGFDVFLKELEVSRTEAGLIILGMDNKKSLNYLRIAFWLLLAYVTVFSVFVWKAIDILWLAI